MDKIIENFFNMSVLNQSMEWLMSLSLIHIQMCIRDSSKTDVTKDKAITSFTSGGFNQNDNATGSFQYEYKGQKGAAWFPDNWMHTSTSGTDALNLKVKCKALTLIYKLSNSTEYGSADLYVDGKLQATLSGYDTSGWNNGKVYVAIEEDDEAEHTIELRMNDESESKKFTLMAIGYN